MEENKTTRLNRSANYYSDRPNYDHCPEKPEYDYRPERPNYDHCPVKPAYDRYPERPKHDHCHVKPAYDHYPERPNYDHRPGKPAYDHYEDRPKKHDCYDERPNCGCHQEKPEHDDCQEKTKPNPCCCQETNLHPNECSKCCKPLELECPDINCAVCTPILASRIVDFKCFKKELPRVVDRVTFNVVPRAVNCPPYADGAPVCIEKIAVNYTCLGFAEPTLPITLGTGAPTSILNTGELSCSSAGTPLFTSYSGTITTAGSFCCDKGRTIGLIQQPATQSAAIVNVLYTVTGFIGCEPFKATLGPVTDSFMPAFPATTLFDDICLPTTDQEISLNANFELKYSVKCITPLSAFEALTTPTPTSVGTFTARLFDELSFKEKLSVITPDELVVYSTPNGFKHGQK